MKNEHMEPVGILEGNSQYYHVLQGWSFELAEVLVRQSREHTIRQWTPNDAEVRFKDVESAQSWYNSEKWPVVYTLGLSEVSAAGLAWFSRQGHPESKHLTHTFAIRMYSEGRGQGLAYPFAEMVHKDFITQHQPRGIWLETHSENHVAESLYKKLGYTALSRHEDRLVMRYQM